MKSVQFLLLFLFSAISLTAQVSKNDIDYVEVPSDTIFSDTIALPEIDISSIKQFDILRKRVYVTYPYAKTAAERLVALNKGMNSLKSTKEKKKYMKIAEDYINNEFEAKLKKLSRRQGQILIKLIYRQTGVTTYDLAKTLKSGWSAFWSNNTAKLFDLNLKAKYDPYQVNEDYLIETILVHAFESGRLVNQPSSVPIDFDELTKFWEQKAAETTK